MLPSFGIPLLMKRKSPLAVNVAGVWTLDGDATDAVGTNDGTASGAGVTYVATTLTNYIPRNVAAFDGTARITLADSAPWKIGEAGVYGTISAWFKTSSLTENPIFSDWHNVNNAGFIFYLGADGAPRFKIGNNGGGNYVSVGSGNYADNVWHNAVMMFGPISERTCTIDGVVQVGMTVTSGMPVYNGSCVAMIGGSDGGGADFVGQIGEIVFWSQRILSGANNIQLYNAGNGFPYPF